MEKRSAKDYTLLMLKGMGMGQPMEFPVYRGGRLLL